MRTTGFSLLTYCIKGFFFNIDLVSEVGIVTKRVFAQVGVGMISFTVQIILNNE